MEKYLLLVFMVSTILINFVFTKKPYSKRQQAVWRLECELGMIADAECPIDGGWSPWDPWSACHGPCDDVGHRRRIRQCNNPSPSKDGIPCNGLTEQTELCYLTNCTVENFRKLVEGDAVRVLALRQLETVPAIMERCLQMECPFEAIEVALASDNTWQVTPESLWNALQCVRHNLGCLVLGEWSPWGDWSTCGARCGRGLRWRVRRCDNPPPSEAHLACHGSLLQAEGCEGDQCAISELDNSDISGVWSEWGTWSSCSEKCATGIKRRRRYCKEIYTQSNSGIWGTHCRGQHEQTEVCVNAVCVLDGGWSGWSAWGPCSQTCGAGRRSRTRSCTRPIPAGGGQTCVGPKTEVGSCYIAPCEIFTHTVAVFDGESHLQYNFPNKRFTLFHFYLRFLPLSPHGTLVRRGTIQSPHIRLSLQKWHVCLDACGSSRACDLPRICTTDVIEPAVWHSILVTVTNEAASLRLDDSTATVRSTFPCDPNLPNELVNIFVGEKFHGEIQELIFNFIPMNMIIDRDRKNKRGDFSPTFVSNVAYEKSSIEEAYVNLENDQYMRLPCFENQDDWQLRITVKSKLDSGTVLFMHDIRSHNWFLMALLNKRLKLKLASREFRSESSSPSELPLDQWLDVNLSKKKDSNTIEAVINSGERLHVLFGDEPYRRPRNPFKIYTKVRSNTDKQVKADSICENEFFLGGIPNDIKYSIAEDCTSFEGTVASVSINGVLQDFHITNIERYIGGTLQVSSRSASVSGSYHETAWGSSNGLNLTCLHTRILRNVHAAHWLFLDVSVNYYLKDQKMRSIDDGRVLRLQATADENLRGFYTCRAITKRYTRNIVTYGVVGKIQYQMKSPDVTTIIAVLTTIGLVATTLLWLIIEGVNDLRTGYGFFRDAHLSPEEEADAVCKFIDDNLHLIGSKAEAKLAKARARRKAERLASRSNFGAQEPQGLMQEAGRYTDIEGKSHESDTEVLPALPDVNTPTQCQSPHNVYRCETCYISSPRYGSKMSSPKSKIKSSSSVDMTSPRVLCSRLLMSKRLGSKESSLTRKNRSHRIPLSAARVARLNMHTINPSTYVNYSPVRKVLQKFKQLKSNDV